MQVSSKSTCDECAMVTEGTPVTGRGELDPTFPQFTTNSNGLGARHNADQCFGCHAQPTLGGSGGFLVPNPGPQGQFTPLQPENPMFRLFPFRFGKRNVVPSFQLQFGPEAHWSAQVPGARSLSPGVSARRPVEVATRCTETTMTPPHGEAPLREHPVRD